MQKHEYQGGIQKARDLEEKRNTLKALLLCKVEGHDPSVVSYSGEFETVSDIGVQCTRCQAFAGLPTDAVDWAYRSGPLQGMTITEFYEEDEEEVAEEETPTLAEETQTTATPTSLFKRVE